jgi:hypothetical protein
MEHFWSVILPFTFASPVGIMLGYVVSDLAKGAGAAAISALASGDKGIYAWDSRPSLSAHELMVVDAQVHPRFPSFSVFFTC